MQKRTQNTGIIIFGLMAVLTIFFITPLVMRGGCTAVRPTMPALSDEAKKTYADFITAHRQSPAEFIAASFDAHDVVFLSNILFHAPFEEVRKAVPALYAKGVRAIGVDYLLADDQPAIDALLTAPAFDEAKAKSLLAYFMVYFSYQDYLTLFKDVWTLNRDRPRGAAPLRIVGLGMKINRELFLNEAYRDRKDLQKANLNGLTQDDYMYSVLEREVLNRKTKALVFVNASFCLKNVMQKSAVDFYGNIGIAYRGSAAMFTRARIDDRAYVVLFHNVWSLEGAGGSVFPVGGVLDAGMQALPEAETVAAFRVEDSPCRDQPFVKDLVAADGKPVLFKDVCDAYILDGPLYRYHELPLAAGSLVKADILPFLQAQGMKPEDIEKYTVDEFITQANKAIEDANNEMAGLPH
jgi:hypothetical protein